MLCDIAIRECSGVGDQNTDLTVESSFDGGIVSHDLTEEREQHRHNDGCLCGLSENDEEDRDGEVVCRTHFVELVCGICGICGIKKNEEKNITTENGMSRVLCELERKG